MTSTLPARSAAPARPGPVATGGRGFWSLAMLHTKFQFLETIRIPVAVIGNMVFPALALLFFVIPQEGIAQDDVAATTAVTQLAMFSVMSTCLFTFGVGVAEDRALPFDPYVRTLPAGPGPRIVGRVATGAMFAVLGLAPLMVVGGLLTAARPSAPQLAAGFAVLVATAVPFVMLGMTVGYALTSKAAIAVVQVLLFPMAFAGGLFLPPMMFPDWLNTVSLALPSRAARDLVVQVTAGEPASAWALPILLAWTVLFAVLCAVAYRRDEGRRFR